MKRERIILYDNDNNSIDFYKKLSPTTEEVYKGTDYFLLDGNSAEYWYNGNCFYFLKNERFIVTYNTKFILSFLQTTTTHLWTENLRLRKLKEILK